MSTSTHPRFAARRGAVRGTTWWGKAWVRALEEWALGHQELTRGRALARSGGIGSVSVSPGEFVAAVASDGDMWPVRVTLPVLDRGQVDALTEVVAAESGRVAALLAGDLPHSLAEEFEEAGVELLPYGGEFGGACGCPDWLEPCPHALAIGYQLAWLIDADPFVLLHVRGVGREELLAGVHELASGPGPVPAADLDPAARDLAADLDVALDAAVRAARMLELLDDPHGSIDHLW